MNAEIARSFERIADLLEISGADAFRINSYRRVSRILRDLTDDIRVLHEAGKVREIEGIGKSTEAKINEYLATGRIDLLAELEEQVPPGLPALLGIPGVGPKTIAAVHEKLGVANLDDLKKAIESGKLAALAGFGAQSAKKMSEGIAFLESSAQRTPLGEALPVVAEFTAFLRRRRGVQRVEAAGSLRRGSETVGDIDLLCAADDGQPVIEAFTTHRLVQRVLAAGPTKGSVTVALEGGRELQADLRVVPAESFGAALQYFTGSKEHNVRLRELAAKRGWKLNEWGLFDGERRLAGDDEAGVYAALGLPLIPPELREDRREFDKDADFDRLVSPADIRGDLHMHTTASDGLCSIAEMAAAARKHKYEYLAITEHSRSSTIANGLSEQRLAEHIRAIREADAQTKGVNILVGCECDILSDGALDYPDELLAQCDVVIASVHSAMSKGKVSPTERTLAAMENKYVTAIGHPTGRLIGKRPPMDLDIGTVVKAAARTGTALEVNASWQRLDLKDVHIRQAVEAGAMLMINTDAHHVDQLDEMLFGVTTARRGWAPTASIANALPWAKFSRWLKRKRE